MNFYRIIQSPVVTERSTILKERLNQYIFKVEPRSTKDQIKQAVHHIFNVDVVQVRTANFDGKLKRLSMEPFSLSPWVYFPLAKLIEERLTTRFIELE